MQVLVKSVHDAFDYAMSHYYPFGLEEFAERTDKYAVISIQDSHTGGFGIQFTENNFCQDVLTILVDDITKPVDGTILFNEDHARQIIDFLDKNRDADTILIHCYAGQSRSAAVGAFATKYYGLDFEAFMQRYRPNLRILDTLLAVYED